MVIIILVMRQLLVDHYTMPVLSLTNHCPTCFGSLSTQLWNEDEKHLPYIIDKIVKGMVHENELVET